MKDNTWPMIVWYLAIFSINEFAVHNLFGALLNQQNFQQKITVIVSTCTCIKIQLVQIHVMDHYAKLIEIGQLKQYSLGPINMSHLSKEKGWKSVFGSFIYLQFINNCSSYFSNYKLHVHVHFKIFNGFLDISRWKVKAYS